MGRPVSDFQPLRRSLQIAAVAALLVVVTGLVFAVTQQGRYKAETSLIVLPASTLDAADQASFLETLSRGQVVATMAEVAQSGRFEREAEIALKLSTSEAASSTVTVTVVPSTSVLLVNAEADNAEVAEQLADRTAALSATYLQSMIKPYAATQVRPARGTAYSAGTATWLILAGTLIAALAVALAVQQASYQVLQTRRRPPRRVPVGARRPDYPAGVNGRSSASGSTAPPTTPAAIPATATAGSTSAAPHTPADPKNSLTEPKSPTDASEWSSLSGSADWKSTSALSGTASTAEPNNNSDNSSTAEAPSMKTDPAPSTTESDSTNERVLFS